MSKPRLIKLLVVCILLFGLYAAYTASSSSNTMDKSMYAGRIEWTFGFIYDDDMEEAHVVDEVRKALDDGMEPDMRDEFGETLLLQSIKHNWLSVVRLLLARGAEINLPDLEKGDTPLIRAAYLDDRSPEMRPLMPLVELLLQKGANPNLQNKEGDTALILVVAAGHSDAVAALLKAGADYKLRNKYGDTALRLASEPAVQSDTSFFMIPLNPNEPEKDIEKELDNMRDMNKSIDKRITEGRAEARRFLIAAGARE